MSKAHMRHLPDPLRYIIKLDRRLDEVRFAKVVSIGAAPAIRALREERDRYTAGAHEVYGHTPAHGGRGPSSAGAVAA